MSLSGLMQATFDHILNRNNKDFNIDIGHIKFFFDNTCSENGIYIANIFFFTNHRNKGIFTMYLNYLEKININEIWILQSSNLMNCILLTTKLNGKYFTNAYTGEHYWKRNDEFYCDKKSEKIANIFLPLKKSLKYGFDNFNNELLTNYDLYRNYI